MIPYGSHHLDDDDIQAVVDVLKSGVLTQGPAVEVFEHAIANYTGAKYAVAVSSATAGLHIAALTAGVGSGSTVITSPITFVASANAALYAGAETAFSDIDPDTVNLSVNSLKVSIESIDKISAIIPVHFSGLPCDMLAIKTIADEKNISVIEDAAHALGAKYPDGSMVGNCNYSDMTVFSFHPVKAIAGGEGGMITTNNETMYRKLLRLRSHGINKLDDPLMLPEQAGENGIKDPWYYEMQELGFNYRMTDIQCGLAMSQLKKLNKFICKRRELVKAYDNAFSEMKNCRPAQTSGRDISGHHLYVIRVDYDSIGISRANLINKFRERDINCQVHYIPVPAHPYYRKLGFKPEDYPAAMDYYNHAISIPLFYDLTDEQQMHVIQSIKELIG